MDFTGSRLDHDLKTFWGESSETFWKTQKSFISHETLHQHERVFLEIGAGTGGLFLDLARENPGIFFVAVERDRMRGNRLLHRAKRAGLANLAAYRGNAIPALIGGIPDSSLERIYVLYPCPWPKNSQRKHRWYLHPVMPHLVRLLRPGGLIVWASDQKFYIDEARYVCERAHRLRVLVHGELKPNAYNHLHRFPEGRTKFERSFLADGNSCHELIVEKS